MQQKVVKCYIMPHQPRFSCTDPFVLILALLSRFGNVSVSNRLREKHVHEKIVHPVCITRIAEKRKILKQICLIWKNILVNLKVGHCNPKDL